MCICTVLLEIYHNIHKIAIELYKNKKRFTNYVTYDKIYKILSNIISYYEKEGHYYEKSKGWNCF